jgi:hypothetical protein
LILFDSISHLLLLVSVFALQSASGGKMDEVFVEHFAMEQEIFAPYSLYFFNVRRRLLLDLRTQPTCEDVIKESVEVVTVVIIVVVIIILSLVVLLIIVIFDVESLSGKKKIKFVSKKNMKFFAQICFICKKKMQLTSSRSYSSSSSSSSSSSEAAAAAGAAAAATAGALVTTSAEGAASPWRPITLCEEPSTMGEALAATAANTTRARATDVHLVIFCNNKQFTP